MLVRNLLRMIVSHLLSENLRQLTDAPDQSDITAGQAADPVTVPGVNDSDRGRWRPANPWSWCCDCVFMPAEEDGE